MRLDPRLLAPLLAGTSLLLACSDDSGPGVASTAGAGDASPGTSGQSGSTGTDAGGTADASGSTGTDAGGAADASGSTGTDADGGSGTGDSGCDDGLLLTVRDFTEAHADFENRNAWERGLVEEDLGEDSKPVYAHEGSTSATEGPEEFNQWYRDVDQNIRFEVEIRFEEQDGNYVYDNDAFFPIDEMGFGNGPGDVDHNFLFTTEAHTQFSYSGGEVFTFEGDDDLWIFINGKLAIDLGGVHGVQTATVDLDEEAERLGIEIGETYPMDIFHAERHRWESNFRIETTIDLSCIENIDII